MRNVLILFCSFPLFVFSQNLTKEVRGIVQTKDLQPVAGATVYVKEPKITLVSDSLGLFHFKPDRSATYTFIVSYLGQLEGTKKMELSVNIDTLPPLVITHTASQLEVYTFSYQKSANEVVPSSGKSGIVARDLPQLTQTIDRSVMDRQQILRVSDLLQNTTGIYVMGNTGGYQEEIASRGFPLASNNTFKNGVRFNNAIMPELSNVEKVEFLKGGSAILYGNVSPGGIMNIITKKPQFKQGGEIAVRLGSYGLLKPSVDVYGALAQSKKLAYRFNTSFENAHSYRSQVSSDRLHVNPSILYQIHRNLQWLLEWDYLSDTRTPDFGIGAINYQIPAVHRSSFLNVSWAYNKVKQQQTTSTLTWQFLPKWKVKTILSAQQFNQDLFGAARPNSNNQTIQSDGTWIRGLQRSQVAEQYRLLQSDVTGQFNIGMMLHQVLIGADVESYATQSNTYNTTSYNNNFSNTQLRNKNIYDTINIFNPQQKRNDIPYVSVSRITRSPIQRYGVYIQDLFNITNTLKILAGVRFSSQSNLQAIVDTVGKKQPGYVAAYFTKAWSPKIALIYQPYPAISLFGSYSNSFTPNSGTDINNQPLAPSLIDQYELGSKFELFDKNISLNMAIYNIQNSNFAQTVLPVPVSNPTARELAGSIASKGFELDMSTKSIRGFSVIAGYSFNETRYVKSNIYAKNDLLRYNPKHTANAHVNYQFSDHSIFRGFQLSGGYYYVGTRVGGRNTSVLNPTFKLMSLPAYSLVDLSAGYQMRGMSIRIKLSNVWNRLSYNVHDDNSINPIAPRQYVITFLQKI